MFCSNDDKFVIFFGDAGTGKTSWVQKLAYVYSSDKEIESDVSFKGKELIVVKLREVNKLEIQYNGICEAINKYLAVKDEENGSWFENKYLVLDGMDEIYVENSHPNYGELLHKILMVYKNAYKVVITSRPGIQINQEDAYTVYKICPYNQKKKEEWIEKYETVISPKKINEEIRETILGRTGRTSIFDYPQLLYMIAGSNPDEGEWSIQNKWSIYHHILYEESYAQHSENKDPEKLYRTNRDKIYTMLKRIAYDMYKKGSTTKINTNTIYEITKEDTNEEEIRTFAYRFGCYWGIVEGNSEVEFYHNNIRDFFIAEYISSELDIIFKKITDMNDFEKTGRKNEYEKIQKKLYKLLRSVPIHKEVVEFMSLKIKFYKDQTMNNDKTGAFYNFLVYNYLIKRGEQYPNRNNNAIANFMKKLFTNLNIYYDDEDYEISSLKKISCFLNNYISIVCTLLENEKSSDVLGVDLAIKGECFKSAYVYRNLGEYCSLKKAILFPMDLSRADLRGADLSRADLSGADLRGAYLNGANLNGADLGGAYLYRAYLRGAYLRGADLTSADLRGADLREAYLRRANLREAYLYRADLREAFLYRADLRGADLREANLNGADLTSADLREANLNGADLQDAKYTMEQLKQALNWNLAKNIRESE